MMDTYQHAFDLIEEKCKGKLLCMRVCPTEAIRVRNAKAKVDKTLCIDCGECIVACPENAFKPQTDSWEDAQQYAFKVAIPSPSLFGQFPMDITPNDIGAGLLAIGFDAVYGTSTEAEIINLAIRDYLDKSSGPYPLISSSCPVVVRLIQVAYPDMVGQIVPIEPPREIAGKEAKDYYAKKTGLPPEEIGAIYLSPCPAKVTAIKQPAELVRSHLDLGIGISEIYNQLYSEIMRIKEDGGNSNHYTGQRPITSKICLGWETRGGQCTSLKPSRYISVAQLPNVIRIFDDIEKGKIERIEFLECYACAGGCIGGPYTVDDTYVASSKVHKLIETIEGAELEEVSDEAKKLYREGEYFIRQPVQPRVTESGMISIEERIARVKIKDRLISTLPGIDCGLCGAPSCEAFADDVSKAEVSYRECILLARERSEAVKKAYQVEDFVDPTTENAGPDPD